jgi:uncharacterized membrane protein YfcA
MSLALPDLPAHLWAAVLLIGLVAGVVKGAVGFAMPMVLISGLGSILPPEVALAALILPTLVTNVWQSLRNGVAAALASTRAHWRYIAAVAVMILFSAQLVRLLPSSVLFLLIGAPVTLFAILQLAGVTIGFPRERRRIAEVAIGALAGFIGGISGVWGPPTVIYLTALGTPKVDQMRTQGIVYGLGSVVLAIAHLKSGILNGETAPLSLVVLVPAMVGTAIGFAIADRLDQRRFRQATLVVLAVTGLNLVRRGLTG